MVHPEPGLPDSYLALLACSPIHMVLLVKQNQIWRYQGMVIIIKQNSTKGTGLGYDNKNDNAK